MQEVANLTRKVLIRLAHFLQNGFTGQKSSGSTHYSQEILII